MHEEVVQLQRLPFARATVIRKKSNIECKCDWCGDRQGKFNYGTSPDSGRDGWYEGNFCSIGCLKAYHDIDFNEG